MAGDAGVNVSADTTEAMRQIRQLEAELRKVLQLQGQVRGGTGAPGSMLGTQNPVPAPSADLQGGGAASPGGAQNEPSPGRDMPAAPRLPARGSLRGPTPGQRAHDESFAPARALRLSGWGPSNAAYDAVQATSPTRGLVSKARRAFAARYTSGGLEIGPLSFGAGGAAVRMEAVLGKAAGHVAVAYGAAKVAGDVSDAARDALARAEIDPNTTFGRELKQALVAKFVERVDEVIDSVGGAAADMGTAFGTALALAGEATGAKGLQDTGEGMIRGLTALRTAGPVGARYRALLAESVSRANDEADKLVAMLEGVGYRNERGLLKNQIGRVLREQTDWKPAIRNEDRDALIQSGYWSSYQRAGLVGQPGWD